MSRISRTAWIHVAAALLVGLWAEPAAAQTQSLIGSQGSASSSSRSRSASAGGNQAGQSLVGNQAGLGGNTQINTEAGATGINTDFGTGLVGRRDVGERFVGNQQAGQQRGRSSSSSRRFSATRSPTVSTSSVGRSATSGSRFRSSTGFGGTSTTSLGTFRPQYRIAFATAPHPRIAIRQVVRTRLQKILAPRVKLRDLQVEVQGNGQVVLRGEVDSEAARRLAENLIRLEPGVRSIRNELTVQPAGSRP